MNTSHDSLSAVLRSWRVNPPADPDFRRRVWSRIGQATPATWPAYLRSHATAWSMAAMLALGAAAYTGTAVARTRAEADRKALVVTYLVDLDPRVQAVLKPGAP